MRISMVTHSVLIVMESVKKYAIYIFFLMNDENKSSIMMSCIGCYIKNIAGFNASLKNMKYVYIFLMNDENKSNHPGALRRMLSQKSGFSAKKMG